MVAVVQAVEAEQRAFLEQLVAGPPAVSAAMILSMLAAPRRPWSSPGASGSSSALASSPARGGEARRVSWTHRRRVG